MLRLRTRPPKRPRQVPWSPASEGTTAALGGPSPQPLDHRTPPLHTLPLLRCPPVHLLILTVFHVCAGPRGNRPEQIPARLFCSWSGQFMWREGLHAKDEEKNSKLRLGAGQETSRGCSPPFACSLKTIASFFFKGVELQVPGVNT